MQPPNQLPVEQFSWKCKICLQKDNLFLFFCSGNIFFEDLEADPYLYNHFFSLVKYLVLVTINAGHTQGI